jgi:hypothetical protein
MIKEREMKKYFNDGANNQAQAVLALIGCFEIEDSWNPEYKTYDADILVGRWENCREQGYVLSLRNKKYKQINVAFFEHRNSDEICAVVWDQNTTNTPNIDSANFGDVYKNKFDVSHLVKYGHIAEMAEYIKTRLIEHWNS